MKERPILFNAQMVRALLDGSKTQTRRVMKGAALDWISTPTGFDPQFIADAENRLCPYGQPGDRLWVRETWAIASKATDLVKVYYSASERQSHTEFHEYFPVSLAGHMPATWPKYRPSIHMPRWASRITLEIVSVRVERLQDISEGDAVAEGCIGGHGSIPGYQYAATPMEHYHWLWNSINGPSAWEKNPFVWCVEFKLVMP